MRKFILLCFISLKALSQFAVDEPQDQKILAKELKAEQSFSDGMKYFLIEDFKKAEEIFKNNLLVYGESATNSFMLSKTELALEKFELAMISARKAAEDQKDNFYFVQHLANLQFKTNHYKDAENSLKKATKLNPNFVEGYLLLVDTYLTLGKESDAIKTLNDMEKNLGTSEKITEAKQAIFLKQNKVGAALKEGEKMVKEDPEFVLQQAQIMISKNRFSEATQLLKTAIDQNENFVDAYGVLAECYAKQNDKLGTSDVMNAVLTHENLPFALKANVLGAYFSTINKYNEEDLKTALGFCNQLITLHPKEARTYVYKGDVLIKSKQIQAGKDAYLEAVKHDSGIFEAWLAIIELDVKHTQYADLIQHAEKALEYYPNQAYFWYNLGLGQMKTKVYDDALLSFEEAQAINPNNNELAQHIKASIAETYSLQGNTQKAIAFFEEILKENPKNEQALNNYSLMLANNKNEISRALKLAENLINLYPTKPASYDTKAWIYFKSEDYKIANEMIDIALSKTESPSETLLEHKGDILFKIGDLENAINYWNKAYNINKSNKKIENKIRQKTIIE
jgi:tetratricopeptide (TPR) repeat protein